MKFYFLFFVSIISFTLSSQTPSLINYQGVARDAAGVPLINQALTLTFVINTNINSNFYSGNQSVITNSLGLFNTTIGSNSNPLPTSGWDDTPAFLTITINMGAGNVTLPPQQLLTVPYAFYAKEAGSAPAPSVTFSNNILNIGGNTVVIASGTTYSAGNGISILGGIISNTLTPTSTTYTSGQNISITSGSVINSPTYSLNFSDPNNGILSNGLSSSVLSIPLPTVAGGTGIVIGSSWPNITISASSTGSTGAAWSTLGNTGTNPSTNFIGTTDFNDLVFKTANSQHAVISSVGNVGIGITTPLSKLDVSGSNPSVINVINTFTGSAINASNNSIADAAANIINSGTGNGAVALNVTSAPTGTGQVALKINNGHIKSTGPAPTVSVVTNGLGGFVPTASITAQSTDTKGTITVAISGFTGAVALAFVDVNVVFNKQYNTGTTVILTPVETSKFSYVVTAQNGGNFTVKIINNSGASTSFAAGFNFLRFNYFVIE